MPELYEVIEALAVAASHSPGWTEGTAALIAEWVENEQEHLVPKLTDEEPPPAPKPAMKTGGKA